jgi:glycoprotein-N-acetylgalactosamine 3-beta-galactosyltransferase
MLGGPGYIWTKEAITRFVEIGLHFNYWNSGTNVSSETVHCVNVGHQGAEDLELGKMCIFFYRLVQFFFSIIIIIFQLLCHNISFKGSCLAKLNITIGDSRDENEMERFLPHSLEDMICDEVKKPPEFWYIEKFSFYPLKQVSFLTKRS